MRGKYLYSIIVSSALIIGLMPGCRRSNPKELLHATARGELDSAMWIRERAFEVKASPQVVLALLREYKVPYQKNLIPNMLPISAGQLQSIQALLLGFESVDFIYLTYYHQHKLADTYAAHLTETGEDLGLTSVLRLPTLDSVRRTWEVWEEILPQLNVRFVETNEFLRNQSQQATYFLVAAAMWLECTRILAASALETGDKRLRLLVAEQGFMLNHLENQLAGLVYASDVSSGFFEGLVNVRKAYNGVQVRYKYETSETNETSHLTKIKNSMRVSMSKQQLRVLLGSLEKAKAKFYEQIEGI